MFPNGLQDFRSFADDAAKEGFSLSSHRMSGGLYPDDPDYCVKPDPGLMTWGRTVSYTHLTLPTIYSV